MERIIKKSNKLHLSNSTTDLLATAISWLCMGLFLYTAYAKIVDHTRFLRGLERVSLIGGAALVISFAVPAIEIVVAFLLLIPRTLRIGLYTFIGVMTTFTIYIGIAMIWEKKLPCHCGGAIEKLSWAQHLWFNIGFIAIALFALLLVKSKTFIKN